MGKRTGLPSLMKVAKRMCRLLYTFHPVIVKLYGDNEALMAALTAAQAACTELQAQIVAVLPEGD